MCGFVGLLNQHRRPEALEQTVSGMMNSLRHRGPDDSGVWLHPDLNLALGFRRLAIVELSDLGHQPMVSRTGRFTLVFNGEIYNYRELRSDLSGFGASFRGGSDTEVILSAFEVWGVQDAIRRFLGMFAIAVWDEQEGTVTLVRDRLGLKPLFIHKTGGRVAFASELKAFHQMPGFRPELDLDALTTYLRHLYVPAPLTIYRSVSKLLPGHSVTVSRDGELSDPEPFWDIHAVMRQGLSEPFQGSEKDAVDRLEQLLGQAVESRLHADVPVGAFLSAGVDSSTVVAFMQERSARRVSTYSIGFEVEEHNEAQEAAKIAASLGTEHTELKLTGAEALAVVPKLPEIFDEPHADTSQIPQYLLCAKARDSVTVALSGDGGDEVFGGYNRYVSGAGLIQKVGRVPSGLRRTVGRALKVLSPAQWDSLYGAGGFALPSGLRHRLPGEKIEKFARMLQAEGETEMYQALVSGHRDAEAIVPGGRYDAALFEAALRGGSGSLVDRMMLADQLAYLPDDQLAKVDRVSMAVSLEVRVPLVDHRLVEFAWSLPGNLKMRGGVGKWILREVLYRRVPRELVDRPKMGLSVPLAEWLQGPLRPWAEDLLDPAEMRSDGILDAERVSASWSGLRSGRSEFALGLWAILMFLAWRRKWL